MKKVVAMINVIIFVFLLNSCSESHSERLLYTSKNMEVFISDWKEAQKNPEAFDEGLYSSENVLIVPVLESEDFVFYFVEANIYHYFYYYIPKDVNPDDLKTFDYKTGIVVSVSKNKIFHSATEKYETIVPDKYAYDKAENSWKINYNEKLISVNLPSNLTLEGYEKIEQYFTFQEINNDY